MRYAYIRNSNLIYINSLEFVGIFASNLMLEVSPFRPLQTKTIVSAQLLGVFLSHTHTQPRPHAKAFCRCVFLELCCCCCEDHIRRKEFISEMTFKCPYAFMLVCACMCNHLKWVSFEKLIKESPKKLCQVKKKL